VRTTAAQVQVTHLLWPAQGFQRPRPRPAAADYIPSLLHRRGSSVLTHAHDQHCSGPRTGAAAAAIRQRRLTAGCCAVVLVGSLSVGTRLAADWCAEKRPAPSRVFGWRQQKSGLYALEPCLQQYSSRRHGRSCRVRGLTHRTAPRACIGSLCVNDRRPQTSKISCVMLWYPDIM
jgi:hypothetical protein